MTKKTPQKKQEDLSEEGQVPQPLKSPTPFTGVARSLLAYDNNVIFRNYRIVTLFIEEDVVVKTEYSDCFVLWEAMIKLERFNQESSFQLDAQWKHGKAFAE